MSAIQDVSIMILIPLLVFFIGWFINSWMLKQYRKEIKEQKKDS